MELPEPSGAHIAPGLDLMPHQAQVVAAARAGHRTFLLADEPGLGKTAQALLAAQAARAFPLLVVVPNVVKTSWAREAAMWTPSHPATVVHSDGETIDAFSDIVIVNYDILNRHVGWLGTFGFRGMVIDEAHFIKNKTSLRSKNVLDLSRKVRRAHRRTAAHGADRHAADQRHRGLPRHLGVPRLDRATTGWRRTSCSALEAQRPYADRARLLSGRPAERHRAGDRPAPQGGSGQGHPRPAHRRRTGRARRRPRPSRSATPSASSSSAW